MSFSRSGIKLRNKKLNLNKIYEKDRNVIHILHKNKHSRNKMLLLERSREISQTLKNLKTYFLFEKTPSIKQIKEENDIFKKEYNAVLSNIKNEKTEKLDLKDLILKYKEKGYKIPKINFSNDIYKTSSLMEANTERLIRHMINSSNDYHGKKISVKENEKKVLYYLYKLRKLIDDKLYKQDFLENFRTEINQSLAKNINQNQLNTDNEENEVDLLNQIKNLLNLINEAKNEFKIKKTKFLKSKTKKFLGLLNSTNNTSKSLPRKIKSFSNLLYENNQNNQIFTLSSNNNNLNKRKENIKNLKSHPPILKISISDFFKKKKNRKIKNVVLSPQINNNSKKESSCNFSNLFHSRISSRSTLFTNRNNNIEKKYDDENNYDNLLEMAYDNLYYNNNYETIKCLKKILKKIKHYSNEELENIWMTESNENLLTNVGKIKDIIHKGKIHQKTEKIYLSNAVIQRVKPKLKKMIENEKIINNFEKDYVKTFIYNQ